MEVTIFVGADKGVGQFLRSLLIRFGLTQNLQEFGHLVPRGRFQPVNSPREFLVLENPILHGAAPPLHPVPQSLPGQVSAPCLELLHAIVLPVDFLPIRRYDVGVVIFSFVQKVRFDYPRQIPRGMLP